MKAKETMYHYILHGVRVVSTLPLNQDTKGPPSSERDSLRVYTLKQPLDFKKCSGCKTGLAENKRIFFAFCREKAELFLRIIGVADVLISKNEIGIHQEQCSKIFDSHLLEKEIALWLELNGISVLHASSVSFHSQAIGFLGHPGHGKTSLATAFLRQGALLLSDDILPLRYEGENITIYPGVPQTRLWPDSARQFTKNHETLDRVHPDFDKRKIPLEAMPPQSFCKTACPLSVLYLLSRYSDTDNPTVRIEPLRQAEAFLALVGQSYNNNLLELLGLQPSRLKSLARVIRQIPVKRLHYPSGWEYLPAVCNAICADIRSGYVDNYNAITA